MQKSGRYRKRKAFGVDEGVTLGELRDERKFDKFVCQSYERLLGFAFQILGNWEDAKDVLQTVFVELWDLVTKRLRNPNADALAVSYQLVKQRAFDLLSKRSLSLNSEWTEETHVEEAFDSEVDLSSYEDRMVDVEGVVIAVEKREAIRECGKQLEGRAREVFLLLMQDASRSEISKVLGVSAARVSQLVRIVFVQLKRKLQEMGYDCNETIGVPLRF